MEHTHWWGAHMNCFGIVPIIFMIFMFIFAVRMFRRWGHGQWGRASSSHWRWFDCCTPDRGSMERRGFETPRQILDRRYAGGEITKEDYENMKMDIEPGKSRSTSDDEG